MKKWLILLMCLPVLIAGCRKQYVTSRPHPFIKAQKMEDMLFDCYLLEAGLRIFEQEDSLDLDAYGNQEWQRLLEKYDITEEQWKSNFNYYISHSNLADSLMAHVSGRLLEWQAEQERQLAKGKETEGETDNEADFEEEGTVFEF